jgi:hypothetical protein
MECQHNEFKKYNLYLRKNRIMVTTQGVKYQIIVKNQLIKREMLANHLSTMIVSCRRQWRLTSVVLVFSLIWRPTIKKWFIQCGEVHMFFSKQKVDKKKKY